MLAINRVPFYKNKLFFSGVAVVTGFGMTVGIIRAVSPPDTSTHESVIASSDKRASSLIPINASSSESSSESGDTKGNVKSDAGTQTSVSAGNRASASTSSQIQASSTTSSKPQSSQPATSSGTKNTTQSQTSSSNEPSSSASPSTCLVSIFTIRLICS